MSRSTSTRDAFALRFSTDPVALCRKTLLATGVIDKLPDLEGIEDFYGTSVHHCPYCDGWEHRDGRIAVYGRAKADPVYPS